MNEDQILELIKRKEDETLEFKTQVPDRRTIGRHICALANTQGGHIVFGVEEGFGVDTENRVVGISNYDRAISIAENTVKSIKPILNINIYPKEIEGKKVLIIEVPKGESPPFSFEGSFLERSNDKLVPIDRDKLLSLSKKRIADTGDTNSILEQMADSIDKLTDEIRDLKNTNKQLLKSNKNAWILSVFLTIISLIAGYLINEYAPSIKTLFQKKEIKNSDGMSLDGMSLISDFYIDMYEYPNKSGKVPFNGTNLKSSNDFIQFAEDACVKQNKTLCSSSQITTACSFLNSNYVSSKKLTLIDVCNLNSKKINKSGANLLCTNEKTFDMIGNLWELSKDNNGKYVLLGGSFDTRDLNLVSCGFHTSDHIESEFTKGEVGFRCCK